MSPAVVSAMPDVDMLTEAQSYAARGWPVFPLHHPIGDGCSCGRECKSIGKHPLTAHGLEDATTDLAQIREWWGRWPDANIGARTGVIFDVLDVDHDDPADATSAWPAVDMPGGPVVRTGKGFHFMVESTGIGNRARIGGAPVDFRGAGGYVILPPSLHASGRRYEWFAPMALDLHPAPAALLTLLDPPRPIRAPVTVGPAGERSGWNAAGLVGRLATAVDGERNTVLNWAAHRIGCDVFRRKATEGDARTALDQLVAVAEMVGLEDREIEATMRSGFAKGVQGVSA